LEDLLPDPDEFNQLELLEVSDYDSDLEPEQEKPPKRTFLRVISLVVLLSWVIGVTGLSALFVDRKNTENEQTAVFAVVDQYMKYMQVNNAEDAYQLLSSRQQQITPISELEEQLTGRNHIPFEGYHKLRVKQFNIRTRLFSNMQLLPGMAAELIGEVNYIDGYKGEVTAVLEKQNGEWKLSGIKIIAPPDKFQKILRF
jgi:hypothetical protein